MKWPIETLKPHATEGRTGELKWLKKLKKLKWLKWLNSVALEREGVWVGGDVPR